MCCVYLKKWKVFKRPERNRCVTHGFQAYFEESQHLTFFLAQRPEVAEVGDQLLERQRCCCDILASDRENNSDFIAHSVVLMKQEQPQYPRPPAARVLEIAIAYQCILLLSVTHNDVATVDDVLPVKTSSLGPFFHTVQEFTRLCRPPHYVLQR